jgi:hypothetical protein
MLDLDCTTQGYEVTSAEVQLVISRADNLAGELVAGSFELDFMGETTGPIRSDFSAAEMKAELDRLPTIGEVYVTRSTLVGRSARAGGGAQTQTGDGGYTWSVTFVSEIGDVPMMTSPNNTFPQLFSGAGSNFNYDDVGAKIWIREFRKGRQAAEQSESGPKMWNGVQLYDSVTARYNREWFRPSISLPLLNSVAAAAAAAAAVSNMTSNGTLAADSVRTYTTGKHVPLAPDQTFPTIDSNWGSSADAYIGHGMPNPPLYPQFHPSRLITDDYAAFGRFQLPLPVINTQSYHVDRMGVGLEHQVGNPAFVDRDFFYTRRLGGSLLADEHLHDELNCLRAQSGRDQDGSQAHRFTNIFFDYARSFASCHHTIETGRLDLHWIHNVYKYYGNRTVNFWPGPPPPSEAPEVAPESPPYEQYVPREVVCGGRRGCMADDEVRHWRLLMIT